MAKCDLIAAPKAADAGRGRHSGRTGEGPATLFHLRSERAGIIDGVVDFEQCDECGFNGEEWTDASALAAIAGLPTRFANAVAGLSSEDLLRRPVDRQWSIAEYTDHVREVLFGMRFMLDMTLTQPGSEILCESPSSALDEGSRAVSTSTAALAGIGPEATSVARRLSRNCLPKTGT